MDGGKEARSEAGIGGWLDMPVDEGVVLQAKTNCINIPLKYRGYVALECGAIRGTKKCMGLKQSDPIYCGR